MARYFNGELVHCAFCAHAHNVCCSRWRKPMIPRTYLSFRKFVSGLLLAPVLSVFGIAAPANDYSQKTVAELINDLAQIDSQSPRVNSAAIYEGFVAEDSPGSFEVGVLGESW